MLPRNTSGPLDLQALIAEEFPARVRERESYVESHKFRDVFLHTLST